MFYLILAFLAKPAKKLYGIGSAISRPAMIE